MPASQVEQKAILLRSLCLTSTTRAGSGHPTSCLSAVDLMAVLFESHFHFDIQAPDSLANDRLVLSKGHSAPLLYALFAMSGAYPLSTLDTLRKFGSILEGHPTSHFPFAQGATGSLGQGLSIGAGIALGLEKKFRIQNSELRIPKTYVLLGDGEMAEGQNWEAANFASHYGLSNLIAVIDVNTLGQSQKTMFNDASEYEKRFKAFGFETYLIDGHDYLQIDDVLARASLSKIPVAIIARTIKGKGVTFLEGKEGWHGKALSADELSSALIELAPVDESLRFDLTLPSANLLSLKNDVENVGTKIVEKNDVATREAFGQALITYGAIDESLVVLDGDVQNSTFTQLFAKAFPQRFVQCFIAEQNMASVAVGFSKIGLNPVVVTFASFLTRAADQIRMAAISDSIIHFVGSHVGVSIGEDGPSQMGLEDISLFGTIPGSVVAQPSDAVSARKLTHNLLEYRGITYLRTLRPKTAVIYADDEDFPIGGSKILLQSNDDFLTVVATGITVHESLAAAESLSESGISIRVIDCYSIKPLDKQGILDAIEATREKVVITVEDHFEHGGFGDFVLDAMKDTQVKVVKLAVKNISKSGKKEELMHEARIGRDAIIEEVRKVIQS